MRKTLLIALISFCFVGYMPAQQKANFDKKNDISFALDFAGNHLTIQSYVIYWNEMDDWFNYSLVGGFTFNRPTITYRRFFSPFNDSVDLRLYTSIGYFQRGFFRGTIGKPFFQEVPVHFGILIGKTHTVRAAIGYTPVFGKDLIYYRLNDIDYSFNYTYSYNLQLGYEYHFQKIPLKLNAYIYRKFAILNMDNKEINGVRIGDLEDPYRDIEFGKRNPHFYWHHRYYKPYKFYLELSYSF